jgi:transposase
VAHAASAFGFSRPSFYQAQTGFSKSGMVGLIPQKKGPRRAHKFSPEILEFVASLQVEQPKLHPPDLAQRIREEFGVAVHPRSVERALARSKKKPL